ncbi:MAG TPA: RDD family protein [Vicinamibacterales bacterium]|jgi:uncharacterized RDD family membrane protein YckC|nr:RDD family protein [Vicinamibacterales bacterium]
MERCRNCGYDFSLTLAAFLPELPLRRDARKMGPLDDLSLVDAAAAPVAAAASRNDLTPQADRVLSARSVSRASGQSGELPLFGGPAIEDEPLIKRASPPRPPLAVRRATPDVPRVRGEQPRPQPLDLSLDLGDDSTESPHEIFTPTVRSFTPAARATAEKWPAARPERAEPAAVGMRLVAVLIDLAILAVVDLIVVYFTLQICGIALDDLALVPIGPLVAFLLVQNGGYLIAFTAGGQTLGKMATGIRVVATESAGALDLGRATTRTLVWLILAAPAGLGFLTLFSRDHRGLHDRFAGTRVVRASV